MRDPIPNLNRTPQICPFTRPRHYRHKASANRVQSVNLRSLSD